MPLYHLKKIGVVEFKILSGKQVLKRWDETHLKEIPYAISTLRHNIFVKASILENEGHKL